MTRADDVLAAWAAVDAATSALGTRVQSLIDQITQFQANGLDAGQTSAVIDHLTSLKSQLDAMGSNPANPVPPPAPAPAPIPAPAP